MKFIQADIQKIGLEAASFDAVLMECLLSILPRKDTTLGRLLDGLRPSGRLGRTDVTVRGPLPPDLQGVLTVAACTGDARSLEEYAELIEAAGFVVDHSQDLPEAVSSFLRGIKGKMLMAETAMRLGKLPVGKDVLARGKQILA